MKLVLVCYLAVVLLVSIFYTQGDPTYAAQVLLDISAASLFGALLLAIWNRSKARDFD